MSLPPPWATSSTEAAGFVEELKGRGVTLYATEEGKLRFRPRSALSTEEVERLKEHKAEILGLVGYRENLSSPIVLSSPSPFEADIYEDSRGTIPGDDTPETTVPQFVKKEGERRERSALELGLIARWARDRGYVSLHDPVTGEWCDVPFKQAPEWARNEAFKRKLLEKDKGIDRLLTRAEMEEIWQQDGTPVWGKAKEVTGRGVVWADYLEEEE